MLNMKFLHLVSGGLGVNTYFLINETTNTAIVIDSGEDYELIKKVERERGFTIKAVLLTHAHFDHAGNAKKLQDDGVKIYISKIDAPKLKNNQNLASSLGITFDHLTPDVTFDDGEILQIEGITVKTLLTPGHTDGSACFMVGGMLFTGDTLFCEDVGRSDFPTGSAESLAKSVKRLFDLDGDYEVYPGHDEFSTLSHERKYNTFIRYD